MSAEASRYVGRDQWRISPVSTWIPEFLYLCWNLDPERSKKGFLLLGYFANLGSVAGLLKAFNYVEIIENLIARSARSIASCLGTMLTPRTAVVETS
jgi:hypothetical protein